MMKYEIGQRVQVELPIKDLPTASVVRKYQGQQFIINGVRSYGVMGTTYNLEGCVGRCNCQYEFFEEWLVPITEGESDDTEAEGA